MTLIDPARTWAVEPSRFLSKSRNTPFADFELTGKAVMTVVGGEIVWREEASG